jgi:threonine dehydratase
VVTPCKRALRYKRRMHDLDVSPARIAEAVKKIDPTFLNTPQFVSKRLSQQLGREVLVKVETLNPIGSFKGRGTGLLAHQLDPTRTWVCSTAGNFGQGLAYAARERGASVTVFVSPNVPPAKVASMRTLGAQVEESARAEEAARSYAAESDERFLVIDGLHPEVAEGAGTIGVELGSAGPIETAVVQVGDGALITGIACWLKAISPSTRIIGVCATGTPAMAESFAAGHPIRNEGTRTIATALAITEPVPESLVRVKALVDTIVLVDDDDLRFAADLIAESLGVLVEPAGAAGVAALLRHQAEIPGGRVAVLLTGASWDAGAPSRAA